MNCNTKEIFCLHCKRWFNDFYFETSYWEEGFLWWKKKCYGRTKNMCPYCHETNYCTKEYLELIKRIGINEVQDL